ncbi:DUF4870 domain-containing protein [Entamoeba marina]
MSDTSCGLPVILESFLAEFFGLIGGIIVFVLEKSNVYCKAHAANAIIWGLVYIVIWVLMVIFGALCSIGSLFGVLFGIVDAILFLLFVAIWIFNWVMALLKAESQEFFAVPVVSGIALKWAEK